MADTMTAAAVREHLNRHESERAWQRRVVKLATDLGWWCSHAWISIHSPAGLPDLMLLRERVVWAELKTERGTLSKKQEDIMGRLVAAGQECYVWRPSDFDAVVEVLR